MKGLIQKDMRVLRQSNRLYFLLIVVYAFITVVTDMGFSFYSSMVTVVALLLPMNCFSWDNYAKWDSFAMALPLSRKEIVGARYLLLLLVGGGAALLLLVLGALLGLIQGNLDVGMLIISSFSSLYGAVLINALMMPLMYRFGPEKARLFMLVAIALVAGLVYFAVRLFTDAQVFTIPDAELVLVPAAVILALVLAGLLALSYCLSCRIYAKKEA